MEIYISLVGFQWNYLCIMKRRMCWIPTSPTVLPLPAPLLTVPPPLLQMPHIHVPEVGSAQCSALAVLILTPIALSLILSNVLSLLLFLLYVFFLSFLNS